MTAQGTAVEPQRICYRAFELIRDRQFDDAEKLLAHWLGKVDDAVARALLHSTFGVLEKRRGHYQAALRHYERAERLIPHDPVIKLITARLLLEVYHETEKAVRKCRQVEKLLPDNPVVVHHAKTLEGLAHAIKGNRRKALQMLRASMMNGFEGFLSCDNIDFHLVEYCLKKGWNRESCQEFLTGALACARRYQETLWVTTVGKILAALS
ncbi:MAG: hypothetical protein HYV02_04235 [Deltaproteobacteria bacterium]|nr:hypothetical protein [Deltaproteobacteria bacterium]